jgi:hypothetical protein
VTTDVTAEREIARLPDCYRFLEHYARVVDDLAVIIGVLVALAITVPLSAVTGVGGGGLLVIPSVGLGCTFLVWQGMKYWSALTLLLVDMGRSVREQKRGG